LWQKDPSTNPSLPIANSLPSSLGDVSSVAGEDPEVTDEDEDEHPTRRGYNDDDLCIVDENFKPTVMVKLPEEAGAKPSCGIAPSSSQICVEIVHVLKDDFKLENKIPATAASSVAYEIVTVFDYYKASFQGCDVDDPVYIAWSKSSIMKLKEARVRKIAHTKAVRASASLGAKKKQRRASNSPGGDSAAGKESPSKSARVSPTAKADGRMSPTSKALISVMKEQGKQVASVATSLTACLKDLASGDSAPAPAVDTQVAARLTALEEQSKSTNDMLKKLLAAMGSQAQ
jgi:hypothetical protein